MGLIGRGGISRECHTSTWLGRISRWILVYSGLAGSSGRNGAQPDDTGGLGVKTDRFNRFKILTNLRLSDLKAKMILYSKNSHRISKILRVTQEYHHIMLFYHANNILQESKLY